MDIYGLSTPDYFRIDDLLDFSNDDIFSSTSATSSSSSAAAGHHLISPPQNPSLHNYPSSAPFNPPLPTDFVDHLYIPSDDVAELEWLSRFVDDSCIDFPQNSLSATGTINVLSDTSFSGKSARSKRSRDKINNSNSSTAWMASSSSPDTVISSSVGKPKSRKETGNNSLSSPTLTEEGVRRCSHCASEKTPQWRTGPLGPKTLCNACGVRYKSGRLVPEYRPAASPTFVLTQHSNSHRKVLELRRQKEMLKMQQLEEQPVHHHHHDFEVC